MADIYEITITTQDGEEYAGKMTRRQPELVNGFVALAQESGEWLYFAPGDVKRFRFTPVNTEEKPDGSVQSDDSSESEVVASGVSEDAGTDVSDDAVRT